MRYPHAKLGQGELDHLATLRGLAWGYCRIAKELGVHWLTVKYHVKREEARMPVLPDPTQVALFPGLTLGRTRTSGENAGNTVKRERSATKQLARCNAILATVPSVAIDRPTCMVCGAPCRQEDDGHPWCRGRRAA